MQSTTKRQPFAVALALAAALTLPAAGCGTSDDLAPLTVAITDAASDDLASFCVTVDAIQLTSPGGSTVDALPSPVRLDLVTLDDVSQVLNVLDVEPGIYTAATITLDFTATNAEAYLKDETMPATLLDGDGNPLTGQVTLPITIGGLLNAAAGNHKVLELDFDLDQSVWVDTVTNTVYVEPIVVLRVNPANPKELIAGGGLISVDLLADRFAVELQTLNRVPIKPVVVAVNPVTTVYQIDGVPYIGDAGLTALAGKAAGTWVQWYGTVHPAAGRFDAAYVEAGTGTYNGGQDIVQGHVVGLMPGTPGGDPTLMVLGHSNDSTHTMFQFNTTFTVNTSFANTKVPVRGTSNALDTDAINVGQRVRIFGTLNSPMGTILDATGTTDVVRLQLTRVLGYANNAGGGLLSTLDLDLRRVGLRDQAQFNWMEGGSPPPSPANLQVTDVFGLGGAQGVVGGSAVEAIGSFTGIADPGNDFTALLVINRDTAPSLLAIHDRAGGHTVMPTVSPSMTPTQIDFTISGMAGAGEQAIIDRGFVGAQTLPASSTVTGTLGFFVISDRVLGTASLHLSFTEFLETLDAALAGSAQIYNFAAIGMYDAMTNTMDAGIVGVVLN